MQLEGNFSRAGVRDSPYGLLSVRIPCKIQCQAAPQLKVGISTHLNWSAPQTGLVHDSEFRHITSVSGILAR